MHEQSLSEHEESALVDAAIQGTGEAWGALYRAFILPIRGFIASRIGSIDDAEDVAEECFIRARTSVDRGLFDRQYRFYTLLRTIAIHAIQDYWRHRARGEAAWTNHHGAEPHPGVHGPTLVEPLERLELLRLVFVCGAKPHQIILFGLVKLLEWRPREVVRERGDASLRSLGDEFLAGYYAPIEQFLSRRIFLDTYCSPLREALELYARDVYVEREYGQLVAPRDAAVGDMVLRVFFGHDPAASISDWCDRVKNRTRKLISTTNIESSDTTSAFESG